MRALGGEADSRGGFASRSSGRNLVKPKSSTARTLLCAEVLRPSRPRSRSSARSSRLPLLRELLRRVQRVAALRAPVRMHVDHFHVMPTPRYDRSMRASRISCWPSPSNGDTAVLQDIAIVGDPQDAADILFGDQHGMPSALIAPDALDDACRTPSAQDRATARRASRQRGDDISARPSASICCSPPDRNAAVWPRRSRRMGNSVSTRDNCVSNIAAVGDRKGADLQVFAHRHIAEQEAALRHQRPALPHQSSRARVPSLLAGKHDRCRRESRRARRSPASASSCRRRWRRGARRSCPPARSATRSRSTSTRP